MAIARIDFRGNITSRNARIYQDIFSYVENSNRIKAVLFVINSGGGDASASEILMSSVKKVRARKPIYSVVEGVGASGAYWMASASTKVYAMNTAVIGSIGVIGISPNVKELMEKIGVKVEVFKVGEYKDMLMPFKDISEDAKTRYMEVLEHSYTVFRESVGENRKISSEELEKVSTGEIFSSVKSLELGLIDKIGTYDDALNDVIKTYNLRPRVKSIGPHRSLFERMIGSSTVQTLFARFMGL